ncbi:MAG: ribonuclease E/G [Lachnospiraceae bacterium]|nr:ribonuclease E/G [Lachnospiraceae bacterium]
MLDYVVTELVYRDKPFTAAFTSEDGKIQTMRIQSSGSNSRVGCISKGYVENVVRQVGGAFVRIDAGPPVFLPIKNKKGKGDSYPEVRGSAPIVVQITKDSSGLKQAAATQNLSVAGRYAVVFAAAGRVSFSSKLSDEEKELIRKWLSDFETDSFRILIRTNAKKAEKAALLREIRELTEKMQHILKEAESAPTRTLLHAPDPFYIEEARDLKRTPDRFFSDIPAYAEQLRTFSENLHENTEAAEQQNPDEILFVQGSRSLSLSELYGLTGELDHLTAKRVWLKSGAFLMIEKTEAFVSVDVNSGSCAKSRIPEETFRSVNLEAAQELARQMRLRNLSGMILVDFISMQSADHNDELIGVMKKLCRQDTVQTQVIDLTPLGIMEIVRQKERKPLAEELSM